MEKNYGQRDWRQDVAAMARTDAQRGAREKAEHVTPAREGKLSRQDIEAAIAEARVY